MHYSTLAFTVCQDWWLLKHYLQHDSVRFIDFSNLIQEDLTLFWCWVWSRNLLRCWGWWLTYLVRARWDLLLWSVVIYWSEPSCDQRPESRFCLLINNDDQSQHNHHIPISWHKTSLMSLVNISKLTYFELLINLKINNFLSIETCEQK